MNLSFLPPPGDADATPEADLAAAFAALVADLHLAAGGAAEDAAVLRAAARAVSLAASAGHACLPVEALGEDAALPPDAARRLRASPLVGSGAQPARPLVLDPDGRLYLQRYWDYERRLALRLTALDAPAPAGTPAALDAALARLPAPPGAAPDRQREAVARALGRRLTVISGGPGTGKTTTLARLIAILATLRPRERVVLAAPTGKAAARLQEALRRLAAADPALAAGAARLPGAAFTLHRLLGWRPGGGFRHGAGNPLACDVLIVDEASMLDLALAARLFDALPAAARVVLVGDRDQLASVEAGAVFGELARQSDGPLGAAVSLLDHSYRFAGGGAIGALAGAVNAGDAEGAARRLREGAGGELAWHALAPEDAAETLAPRLFEGYRGFLEAVAAGAPPPVVLAALDAHRLLCAVREGPRGALRADAALAQIFRERLGERGGEGWYRGRPVMVVANDPRLRLYNGDVGVALAGADGRLTVFFPGGAGGLRAFSPQRLPSCESAFACTVHKAQGSEFDSVDVLLPERGHRVMSRELLYTALTRARSRAAVWGDVALFAAAVAQPTRRYSGLRARIAEAAGEAAAPDR